ncbi:MULTISPECIES: outer membrane beta-barrel protein [Parachlamydia]|jgi:hypothetical protein|uniref:Outer membrane protein beta-barrel domain-containing protein n=2 Tax=Parachlamydia acanthamoebae TaxID=83552 RepID=F8KWQ7_PARAV|nr:outer membrane beta-barrel protein [Parachlamydia acanthamoebae]EFB41056.1 hypothetical protein pah_c050o004 [Parachlamydia acanthamoebae str. Hall's coccus]KIA78224.1 hypothetical protein DB43_EL00350 [Parachlamydia acanthamoebae]CCB86074.1 putative uncharacterized protein [Parachlamydia acanthamoebae UV-7]
MLKNMRLFLALLVLPLALSASEGYYGGLFGGVNFLHKSHTHNHLKYDDGYAISLVGGCAFFDAFRAEVEGSYHRNNLKSVRFGDEKFSCGHARSYCVMGNFFYDLYLGCLINPYVGFGVGVEATHFVISASRHRFKHTRSGCARQVILGLTYPICQHVEASIDYKFRRGVRHTLSQSVCVGIRQFF